MSEFDLFKELSELDEELVMAARKHVSLGMNFWLCILTANITAFLPDLPPLVSVLADLCVFALLYAACTWFLNRKKKRKLLIEDTSSKPF